MATSSSCTADAGGRARRYPASAASVSRHPNVEWRTGRRRADDPGRGRFPAPANLERTMAHLLDPKRIANHATYLAALHELDGLMAEEPDAAANRRIDELFALIEEYEFRQSAPPTRAA
jgi:hypothetical protein